MQSEEHFLAKVLSQVHKRYTEVEQLLHRNEDNYNELKKYTVDYKNELDKYEVYNHLQQLTLIDKRSVMETNTLKKLEYQKEIPYFSRVDFRYEGEDSEDEEAFYIGRFSFSDDEGMPIIYDWRAPIASLYYDYGVGPAAYNAQNRTFHGEIGLKKHIIVEDGELQKVTEYDVDTTDSFLIEELGAQTSNQMKTIVNTIQTEQNKIIRNTQAHHLIVQGVAGSGKTSVALHRIAYLLYHKRDSLKSSDVAILSPNSVFSSYIATVLPELGEQQLRQYAILDLIRGYLPKDVEVLSAVEEQERFIEDPDSQLSQMRGYQKSRTFYQQVLSDLEDLVGKIVDTDVEWENYVVTKEEIAEYRERTNEISLSTLISEIANRFPNQRKKVAKEIWRRFPYRNPEHFYSSYMNAVYEKFNQTFDPKKWSHADAFLYLFLKLKVESLPENRDLKHLVIDEMQDYSLFEHTLLSQLYPCEKTVVGDLNQAIFSTESYSLSDLAEIYPKTIAATLNKSYRSSYEIIQFAKRFIVNQDEVEVVARHRKEPVVYRLNSYEEMASKISQVLTEFSKKDYKTLGIIVNNKKELNAIASLLDNVRYTIYDQEVDKNSTGIIMTTVQFAKGLEFDEVLLPTVTGKEMDQLSKSMYVKATRALHELNLFVLEENKIGGAEKRNLTLY